MRHVLISIFRGIRHFFQTGASLSLVFSERELTFTSLYAVPVRRLSVVCLSSVCFGNVLCHLVPWGPSFDIHDKGYGDRRRGTPASGKLNIRQVAKYSEVSDFGPIEGYISDTVQDRR